MTEFELPADAAVLLYTDGLVENRLRPATASERHLLSYLKRNLSLDLDALLEEFGSGGFSDDVAVMTISLEPRDRMTESRAESVLPSVGPG